MTDESYTAGGVVDPQFAAGSVVVDTVSVGGVDGREGSCGRPDVAFFDDGRLVAAIAGI